MNKLAIYGITFVVQLNYLENTFSSASSTKLECNHQLSVFQNGHFQDTATLLAETGTEKGFCGK